MSLEEALIVNRAVANWNPQVRQVVIDVILERVPLVGAGGILSLVANLGHICGVLIDLCLGVVEVQREAIGWVVGNNVRTMRNTPLFAHLFVRKGRVFLVAHPRLAKVNHLNVDALVRQVHRTQLSQCAAERVPSCFHLVARVELLEPLDFFIYFVEGAALGCIEALVHEAVAVRPPVFRGLGAQVSEPVGKGRASSEDYVDGLIGG